MKTLNFLIPHIFFLCILLFTTNNSDASLTEKDYKKVAKNFLIYLNSRKSITSVEHIFYNQKVIGRVFLLDGSGYLIIPESKILPPIKGYSLRNNYHKLPKAYKDFIISELKVYQRDSRVNVNRSISKNSDRWHFLMNDIEHNKYKKNYTPDTYLLQTTWNQDYPFNKMLPQIDGKYVFAGCTQAAQAQIMKYYQHPKRGQGVASHVWNNQNFETILFKSYHWQHMPNNINNKTSEHIQDEVALLYKDLAIVNNANFGIDGTSTSLDVNAMYENFGYTKDIKRMTNENESEFFLVIRNEIDNKRPVFLSLPNHATVADGYASDPTGKKIHINMGWGGNHDNYYYLNETIYAGSHTYPATTLRIIYNIKPCDPEENNCFHNSYPSGEFDAPPIINTDLKDQIIAMDTQYQIRIESADKDGDIVELSSVSSSTAIVNVSITDDILTFKSNNSAGHSRIFVISRAKNKQTHKYFDVLVNDSNIDWGTEYSIQGIFESQSDYNFHQLLLDKQCKITGDRGFSNQAFYISALDSNRDTIVSMNDEQIIYTFNKSIYWIGASLKQVPNGYGKYYPYDPNNNGYTLFINCPDANWTFQDIADTLGIEIKDKELITLKHVIHYLQILAGFSVSEDILLGQGIKVKLEDALYILQRESQVQTFK